MDARQPADHRPLKELVVELERDLRMRLAGTRLVLEAGLDDATFERVEGIVRRLSRVPNGEALLTRRLPGVLLFHLVGCGSRLENGSFWPTASLEGRFNQRDLGIAFEQAIQRLGLEKFTALVDERALRFLAPILAHGGIPRYAADRYIEILVGTLNRHGMSTAAEVSAFWRTRRTALEFGHRPIRRFLLYGGEPALDYLDRSIELVRLPASEVRVGAAAELQLPGHIVDAYLRFAERAGGDRATARTGPTLPRPRVALDPFDAGGPYLELPAISPALGRGTWTVDDGAAVATYRTSAFDTIRLPLAPSLAWSAELRLDASTVRTSPFEALERSPYVAFEPRTGSYVDDLRPISLEECWLLAPHDAVISGEDESGSPCEVRLLSTLPEPGGPWTGYAVRHLSLEGLASVRVSIPHASGRLTEGRLKLIAATTRPRLIGDPVPGVTTTDGAPVYAKAPGVFVPRLAGVEDTRWSITVTSEEGRHSEPLSRVGSSGTELSLAPLLPGGFGIIDVAVRGPLGSDLRRRFAVVPEIRPDVPSTVLLPGDEIGRSIIVTCHQSIELGRGTERGAPGMLKAPIPRDGDRIPIRVSRDGSGLELVVRIPRLMWAVRRRGSLPQLGTHRDRLDADELIDGEAESLLVSTLIEGVEIRTSLESDGTAIHELPAGRTAPPEGRWAVPLAALRDTVRMATSPHLTLAIDVGGRRVVVAEIVATAKARQIHAELLSGDAGRRLRVSFSEPRRLADLDVRLWSLERPWEPPIVASVPPGDAGEVTFPVDAVRVGRYRVEVAVHDPWFDPRRPAAGAPSCADLDVGDAEELLEADLSLEHWKDARELISLAIVTGLPPKEFRPEHLSRVSSELRAAVRALMADIAYDPRAARPLRALVSLFALEPLQLFEHLASNDHPSFDGRELLRLFLMARPELGDGDLPDLPDRVLRPLWRSCPPFATLIDIPTARAGNPEALARCEEYLGWRPDAEPPPVGRRPELAELSLSPSRQSMLRDMLALVPTALLTWDSYQSACFDWLAASSADTARANAWRRRAAGAVDGVSFGPALDVYVEARRGITHPDFTWADGLRASLACAAHVAVNDGLARFAGALLEELLAISPLLVTHDLVLAMALITPEQAESIRGFMPGESDENLSIDSRWREVLESAARREPREAVVDHVDPDGVVIALVDGIKGRLKWHERGWTLAERSVPITPGQAISVVIIAVDGVNRRLELSARRALPNPWLDPGRRPNPGDVLVATVTGVKPFGLFATTESGVDGLVHSSNLPDDDLPEGAEERSAILAERYPVGTTLRVRVLDVDPIAERMDLSVLDV